MHLNHDVYLREQQASQALLVKPRSTPSGLRPVACLCLAPHHREGPFIKSAPTKNSNTWRFAFESSRVLVTQVDHNSILCKFFSQTGKWKTAGDWHPVRIQILFENILIHAWIQMGPLAAMLPSACHMIKLEQTTVLKYEALTVCRH